LRDDQKDQAKRSAKTCVDKQDLVVGDIPSHLEYLTIKKPAKPQAFFVGEYT
jgi:hypothetical protein